MQNKKNSLSWNRALVPPTLGLEGDMARGNLLAVYRIYDGRNVILMARDLILSEYVLDPTYHHWHFDIHFTVQPGDFKM